MNKCNRKADLGFTNVFGTPYLKFTVSCQLTKGHIGLHRAEEPMGIKPTGEGGDPIKHVQADPVIIHWE